MSDHDAQAALAAAAARIADLERQVAAAGATVRAATQRADALAAELATRPSRADLVSLSGQIDHLRAIFQGAPPTGTGIAPATGYVTSDFIPGHHGHHATLPDARLHAAALGVASEIALTPVQASEVLARRDALRQHFDLADAAALPPSAKP